MQDYLGENMVWYLKNIGLAMEQVDSLMLVIGSLTTATP